MTKITFKSFLSNLNITFIIISLKSLIFIVLFIIIQHETVARVFFINFKIHKEDMIPLFLFVLFFIIVSYKILTLCKYIVLLIGLNVVIVVLLMILQIIYFIVSGCILTSEIYITVIKMLLVLHRFVLPSVLYMALTIYVIHSLNKILNKKIPMFWVLWIVFFISMTIYIVAFQVLYFQTAPYIVIHTVRVWVLIVGWSILLTVLTSKFINYFSIKRLEKWALKVAYIGIASLFIYLLVKLITLL